MGPIELSFESSAFIPDQQISKVDLSSFRSSFESSASVITDAFDGFTTSFDDNLARTLQIEDPASLTDIHSSIMDSAKRMLDGVDDARGNKTLSLHEISKWKLNDNPVERIRNLKQQSGYVAEVISTELENMRAAANKLDVRTVRADDLPDMFQKNDQFVDKVRINDAGEIIERIQTKFIGKNGTDWVSKMMDKKFDKYFVGDHVDKIECPRNYYNEAKAAIQAQIEKHTRQLERVTADGKAEVATKIQNRIDKLTKLDDMIEQSLVTTDQAEYARLHPDRFTKRLFVTEVTKASLSDGLYEGALAAGITFAVSTTTHMSEFLDGEITAEEMAKRVVIETGAAGAAGTATGFVTTAVANTMQSSSCNLIRSVGGSCLPAAAISFAVESYDSVMDYTQGLIEADELAYDLGHNAASVSGGTYAGMKVGAVAGTTLGPVGTVVGGIVGGVVGTAVASGMYEAALEYGPEAASAVVQQIETYTDSTMELVAEHYPEQLDSVRDSFNEFLESNNVPVSVGPTNAILGA